METLQESKEFLRANFDKGVSCPCCNQFVKLYKRKLASTPSRMLIRLHSLDNGWHHVGELAKGISDTGSNDFSKLAYWKLIEEKTKTNDEKKNSGYWKITEKGINFVENKITLQSHVFIYNTKFLGFNEKKISIIEALGNKFNYTELMKIKAIF
jgi:hypothetical protein